MDLGRGTSKKKQTHERTAYETDVWFSGHVGVIGGRRPCDEERALCEAHRGILPIFIFVNHLVVIGVNSIERLHRSESS